MVSALTTAQEGGESDWRGTLILAANWKCSELKNDLRTHALFFVTHSFSNETINPSSRTSQTVPWGGIESLKIVFEVWSLNVASCDTSSDFFIARVLSGHIQQQWTYFLHISRLHWFFFIELCKCKHQNRLGFYVKQISNDTMSHPR